MWEQQRHAEKRFSGVKSIGAMESQSDQSENGLQPHEHRRFYNSKVHAWLSESDGFLATNEEEDHENNAHFEQDVRF